MIPSWAQVIARALPSTYVFEEMRRMVINHYMVWGTFNWFGLNITSACLDVL
jgi:hypothetical protein